MGSSPHSDLAARYYPVKELVHKIATTSGSVRETAARP